MVPGTSGTSIVTENANLDRLRTALSPREATLISTNLTEAERSTLMETFGGV